MTASLLLACSACSTTGASAIAIPDAGITAGVPGSLRITD